MKNTKVINLVNFYNRKATDIVNDLKSGYNDYPFSFRKMLQKHGSEVVTSMIIVRTCNNTDISFKVSKVLGAPDINI